MNAAADGRGKQRIDDRRPGNPSPAFRPIVGGRPDLRRRQIGSGFTRIFVGLAGFRVDSEQAARPCGAVNTNCRNENENEN